MKIFLKTLSVIVLILLIIGFWMQSQELPKAELLIGISVLLMAFVLIPSFIFYRYRNRNLKDYMLTKENIDKMMKHLKK